MRVSESGGVDERRQTEAGPFSASGGPGLTALRGIWNAFGASASGPGRPVSLRSTNRWLSRPHERRHDPTAGLTWSAPASVGHQVPGTDRFNQWLSVDPATCDVTASYYDTQNDATGQRFITDVYLSRYTDGGVDWVADLRVTTRISSAQDSTGLLVCLLLDYDDEPV